MKDVSQKKAADKARRDLRAVEKRMAELDKIIFKLYEDSALGRISEERYIAMSNGYEFEQSALKDKHTDLSEQLDKATEAYENIRFN